MPARPRRQQLPKTLTKDEIEALMSVPNLRAPTGIRNRAMLELMYRSGLRVGETCGLHVGDVRLAEEQIHLRPEVTKGEKEDYTSIDRRAEGFLRMWLAIRPRYAKGRRQPHLFTTLKGGQVSTHYCWQMMRRFAARAGIERPVYPHMLRHTFATELLREGKNLREVQLLLRHSDIQTTTIYTHIYEADLHRKIRERA